MTKGQEQVHVKTSECEVFAKVATPDPLFHGQSYWQQKPVKRSLWLRASITFLHRTYSIQNSTIQHQPIQRWIITYGYSTKNLGIRYVSNRQSVVPFWLMYEHPLTIYIYNILSTLLVVVVAMFTTLTTNVFGAEKRLRRTSPWRPWPVGVGAKKFGGTTRDGGPQLCLLVYTPI